MSGNESEKRDNDDWKQICRQCGIRRLEQECQFGCEMLERVKKKSVHAKGY